uniref:Uncharacterized protein n=1 Tax=Anguilla anguilla TaxID=7936 RepID=A0A0E9S5I0_ANGAN
MWGDKCLLIPQLGPRVLVRTQPISHFLWVHSWGHNGAIVISPENHEFLL